MKTTAICSLGLILLAAAAAVGAEPAAKAPVAAAPAVAPAAATKTPAAAPAAAPTPAKINWDGMSKKERKVYMKSTVLPAAKKLFAEFDAKKYKRVTCVTCHGDGAETNFKMPNPQLPKLPTSSEGFQALNEKKPDAMTFMKNKVKPAMAALLNEPEWTPTNPKGFACYDCHTKDEGGAKAAPKEPTKNPTKPPAN